MAELIPPQSSLKTLIAKGKEQGYLTYAEVNDHLPESISDPDQVEDIIQMINDMGIKVFEAAPDADALLMNEENDSGADEVARYDSDPSREPDADREVISEPVGAEQAPAIAELFGREEAADRLEEIARSEAPGEVVRALARH